MSECSLGTSESEVDEGYLFYSLVEHASKIDDMIDMAIHIWFSNGKLLQNGFFAHGK